MIYLHLRLANLIAIHIGMPIFQTCQVYRKGNRFFSSVCWPITPISSRYIYVSNCAPLRSLYTCRHLISIPTFWTVETGRIPRHLWPTGVHLPAVVTHNTNLIKHSHRIAPLALQHQEEHASNRHYHIPMLPIHHPWWHEQRNKPGHSSPTPVVVATNQLTYHMRDPSCIMGKLLFCLILGYIQPQ